ncbi:MAG: hypothetical protein JW781_08590 [Deltaproteobacteria bacterium]|nr:hypothetical protein [Candidatus Anaeroferrophillacea bacterium]
MKDSLPIHPRARKLFQPFLDDVRAVFGPALHSVHLTGSVVTGDYAPDTAEIESLILLTDLDLARLEALAPLGTRYGRQGIAVPLVLTPEIISHSLDVFPVEYLELKFVHQTVHGDDLPATLEIDRADLRTQCERELRVRSIGLRQAYIAAAGDREKLARALRQAAANTLPVFRALIYLFAGTPPLPAAAVAATLGARAGVGADVFVRIMDIGGSGRKPAGDMLNRLFEDAHAVLTSLVRQVDALV